MSDLNAVQICGRLTRDPERVETAGGTELVKFSIAVGRSYTPSGGGERVDEANFIDITAWGKTVDFICNYFVKGKPIIVLGRLKFDSWEAEDGTKRSKLSVVAERCLFVPKDSTKNGDDFTEEDAPF